MPYQKFESGYGHDRPFSPSTISSLEDYFLFASLNGPPAHTDIEVNWPRGLAWHNAGPDAEKEADINYNDKVGNFCQKI